MPPLPRGECPVCHSMVALRKGGLVREHPAPAPRHRDMSRLGNVCRGSGREAV